MSIYEQKELSFLFKELPAGDATNWLLDLKKELKQDDVSKFLKKEISGLGTWPVLMLDSPPLRALNGIRPWKKASQTYIKINLEHLEDELEKDLENGVRHFFFWRKYLNASAWMKVEKKFSAFRDVKDIEVFLLGDGKSYFANKFQVYSDDRLITAMDATAIGADSVTELGLLLCRYLDASSVPSKWVGVHLDSHFFKNIAVLRALRLCLLKIHQEFDTAPDFNLLALNSYQDWTVFERFSNILRNNTQVAAAYIGGADATQSSGYMSVFEFEAKEIAGDELERSRRIARNTCHVLGLESYLGIVEDAAHGSFHIEHLSQDIAAQAWAFMQSIINLPNELRFERIKIRCEKNVAELESRFFKRKNILSGINDFPDSNDILNAEMTSSSFFRLAKRFEALRFRGLKLRTSTKVLILSIGEKSVIYPRLNFIRNYFETIGLEVHELTEDEIGEERDILVLCAKDEDYPLLLSKLTKYPQSLKFLAGKTPLPGGENIFMGQDIYQILEKVIQQLEQRS